MSPYKVQYPVLISLLLPVLKTIQLNLFDKPSDSFRECALKILFRDVRLNIFEGVLQCSFESVKDVP